MNKRITAVMLTLVMIVGYSFSAMAGTTDTMGAIGDKSSNVTGVFDLNPSSDVFNVTITWGELKFQYGGSIIWDTTNNYYRANNLTDTSTWTATGNTIGVKNNSTKSVNAKVEFLIDANIEGPQETFSGDLNNIGTTSIPTKATDPEADNDTTTYLNISKAPTKILNYTSTNYNNFTIGTVTVTISE